MNGKQQGLFWILASLGGILGHSDGTADGPTDSQILYPASERQSFTGPGNLFTGDVQVDLLFPDNDTADFSGAYVTFQPGARTAWHLHPAGQHMIVTNGVALTGTRDGKVIEFEEGETVWCPPDVDHWHGATPEAPMTHLVITGNKDGENVIWKEKVTDVWYYGNVEQKERAGADTDALTARQQGIVPIAAFTASGDLESLKTAIRAGLDNGLTVNEVKEVQIHLYAYVGFPRSLNGLATLMGVVEERKAKGIADTVGEEEAGGLSAHKSSLELGKAVQTELVGQPVTGPLFDFAPDINTFLQSHLFGDLFARGILDYRDREIVTLSALANTAGVGSQLQAHIDIASNVGITEAQLLALTAVLNERVGVQAAQRAEKAVRVVMPEVGEG